MNNARPVYISAILCNFYRNEANRVGVKLTITITMTPHDFFIQNIWWMLQEILTGVLLRQEKGEFTLQETSENTPDIATH